MILKQLIIATGNQGKIREINDILKKIPFKLITFKDIKYSDEVEETGKTFEENAEIKARVVGEKTQLMTLAEDSGLEVDALDGKPGIYSARYRKGTDLDRIKKVLEELEGIAREKRTARFKSVIAIYDPTNKKTQTFEGVAQGYITDKPLGKNGFGYDPIFFSDDIRKTFGQASDEEKNKVSHRAKALEKAKRKLLDKSLLK